MIADEDVLDLLTEATDNLQSAVVALQGLAAILIPGPPCELVVLPPAEDDQLSSERLASGGLAEGGRGA